MQILSGSRNIAPPIGPVAVAIGIFDGVHRGHQALLRKAVELAGAQQIDSLAYTFDPHPARVLAPQLAPKMIEPLAKRLERFAALGISAALVEHFDRGFAATAPEDFVRDILVGKLRAKHVVVGAGFTFGAKQRGTVALLEQLGAELGFVVHPVDAVKIEGLRVSSTKIREFVTAGQMRGASLLLDRPFMLTGVVERGDGRGSTIGIPTANLRAENELLPGVGVYAGRAHGVFGDYDAVINVGYNPTFGSLTLRIEAHFLDYTGGPLYGKAMDLELVQRLRDEKRFDGVEPLKAQIMRDIDEGRAILRAEHDGP